MSPNTPKRTYPMRLTRIVLEGYTRISLSGIHRLEWTPTAPYQMILGTNGSGKSSLMAECSPNPANKDHYLKGGSKTTEWEHQHATYVLTSTKSATMRHSFKRDGEELNDGGTGAIQKELVEKYFNGYTKELHDILTGRTKFTSMSVNERRKWITRMSRTDYSYALGLYERLRVAGRDIQGHLKHVKQRLHDESVVLMAMTADSVDLEERVKTLQGDLTAMLYARVPQSTTSDQATRLMQDHLRAMETAGAALVRASAQIDPTGKNRSASALDAVLGALESDVKVHESILDRLRVEHSEVETLLHSMESVFVADFNNLDEALEALRVKRSEAAATVDMFPRLMDISEPAPVMATTEAIFPALITLFTTLPDNSDRRISRENLEKARTLRRGAQSKIDECDNAVRVLRQRLHVIEHTDAIDCPQCKFQWVPGINPKEADELKLKITAFQDKVVECNVCIKEADAFLEEAETYMGHYRQWRGYVQQYPSMHLLWDYIQLHQFDTHHPSDHREVFYTWLNEVTQVTHVKRMDEEIAKIAKLAESSKAGEGTHFRVRLTKLESEIDERTAKCQQLRQELVTVAMQRNLYQSLEGSVQGWEAAVRGLEVAYETALGSLATEVIDRDITRVQSQLGALQHSLNAKQILMGVIDELKGTIDRAELEHTALSMLVQELSPKEGLIAEQMHSFILQWVEQLNAVIQAVWTYDLEVLPCEMDNGDLTYRFPMYTGSTDQKSDDVEESSTSIEQIINFAFQQTVMLYLDLEDFPLFIDELGANFDEQHRQNLSPFIARMMESHRYSQLFMISHYVAGWGAFNDAEYLVLDGRNIAVPDNHNTHAILT
jgi:hypothetical protein